MSDCDLNLQTQKSSNRNLSKRKRKKIDTKNEEMILESIVFGGQKRIIDNISKKHKYNIESDEEVDDHEQQKPTISHDSDIDLEKPIDTDEDCDDIEKTTVGTRNSVWADDDDHIDVSQALGDCKKLPKKFTSDHKYKEYLETKFTDLFEKPKWVRNWEEKHGLKTNGAAMTDDSDDTKDSDEESVAAIVGGIKLKSNKLEKGFLSVRKCSNLNNDFKQKAIVRCVEFHRFISVALVATDNVVTLFKVDGKKNAKIQSIKFDYYHIESAHFTNGGQELVVGSSKDAGLFYYYDMIAGKIVNIPFVKGKHKFCLGKFVVSDDDKYIASNGNNGFINVLTTKTKEHVFDFKMNGEVMALAFTADSNSLLSHGSDGRVYVWDIRTRKCVNRFIDEGCVNGSSICLSPNSQFCACGSDMGVVNVYNYNQVLTETAPKPVKSIMNLTTQISTLKFNHTSELLFLSSNSKENAIKCVHMPSLTVYSNFPMQNVNYNRITDFDISVNSGYLSLVSHKGSAYLHRLNYFKHY